LATKLKKEALKEIHEQLRSCADFTRHLDLIQKAAKAEMIDPKGAKSGLDISKAPSKSKGKKKQGKTK
jgi:hypothetical protein